MDHKRIRERIQELYQIVADLEQCYPGRPFTPDGHLVGSIGECLVADTYNLELMPPSNAGYDAIDLEGRKIEIKATQAKSVAFRSCPEHAIIIRLNKDGSFDEFFNGPGELIWKEFEGKKLPSNGQYQISLAKVERINSSVPPASRVKVKI